MRAALGHLDTLAGSVAHVAARAERLEDALRDRDDAADAGAVLSGLLHVGRTARVVKHYDDVITSPRSVLLAAVDPDPFCSSDVLEGADVESAAWYTGSDPAREAMLAEAWGAATLAAVRERCSAVAASRQTAEAAGRAPAAWEGLELSADVGLVGAGHTLLVHEMMDAVARVRVPGVLAVGRGVLFTLPEVGPTRPGTLADALSVVDRVYAAVGSARRPRCVELYPVQPWLVCLATAVVRNRGLHRAWDALFAGERECLMSTPATGHEYLNCVTLRAAFEGAV